MNMHWVCPKCKKELENLECRFCGLEFKSEREVFDFTYDLNKQELAEDAYRDSKIDLDRIIRKKKASVEYYEKFVKDKMFPAGRILDLGAGFCWLGGQISKDKKTGEVWCSDVSGRALEIGKQIAIRKGYDIYGYVRSKAYRLPFPDNYFDNVVSSAFLHHVSSVPEVLKEVKRVLKPAGAYYVFLEPATSYFAKPLSWSRVKKAKREHPGVAENVYTFSQWRKFFKDYKTSIVLTPPFREKWRELWRSFDIYGLADKLLFSNILIKAKFN
jgi:ubiquinone/menaquinone biosynthesis C-methylase UbiE